MKEPLAEKMCSCIKKVQKSLKNSNIRRGNKGNKGNRGNKGNKDKNGDNEKSRAIAICVRTVLQKKHGRTLKRFSCRNTPMLETQELKN